MYIVPIPRDGKTKVFFGPNLSKNSSACASCTQHQPPLYFDKFHKEIKKLCKFEDLNRVI